MRYNLIIIFRKGHIWEFSYPYFSLYIIGRTIIWYIVKCWSLWIFQKCIFIRACFRQQSIQSSATDCLTCLCPVYMNRVLGHETCKVTVFHLWAYWASRPHQSPLLIIKLRLHFLWRSEYRSMKLYCCWSLDL